MNSHQNDATLYILAILVINVIHSVLGQYQPIYFLQSEGSYVFGSITKYNAKTNIYFIDAYNEEILAACPQKDNRNSFKITKRAMNKMNVDLSCEERAQPSIYKMALTKQDIFNTVGFAIHTPGVETPQEYIDAPEEHNVISLITFEFNFKLDRIKYVIYQLSLGRLLTPEIKDEKSQEYQKNDYFYDYDIDILYSQPNCPYVKVPLAPEEDFFYDGWKLATRQNALTAPMFHDLLPQWQALEIFTRKVTQIIKSALIRTGVYGTLAESNTDSLSATINSKEYKYEVPRYFWKMILIDVIYNAQRHSHGILFVMHNINPNAIDKSNEPKLCPNDEARIATTGWNFMKDDELKSPMYACSLTDDNLLSLNQIVTHTYKPLDLHGVPMLIDSGDFDVDEEFIKVDVLAEMEKLERAKKELIQ